MNDNTKHAKSLLPTILLTVLSMIQALALELFWNKIQASQFLWKYDWYALIGWLQVITMFIGILLIWVLYTSTVLRFTWLPTMQDTLIPFFIGLLEFALISLLQPSTLGPWFIVLTLVFALATATNHMAMKQARRDPDNKYFFNGIQPARWRDYSVSLSAMFIMLLLGSWLWLANQPIALSIASLLLALMALAHQFYQAHRHWIAAEKPET